MTSEELIQMMEKHGIKATANRLSIARELDASAYPLSLTELEDRLETIDKSNIFRSLQLFRESHLVHALEDSPDGVRYELCHSHHDEEDDDLHVHFYCTRCHRTFCLEDIAVPAVTVPEGFKTVAASHLVRGLCPDCNR